MNNSSLILIKNSRIITAADDFVADILIENEKIVSIKKNIKVNDQVKIYDATGLLAMPGGVDCHTHLENKFGDSTTCDTFDTGTRAAAFGGTTTIIDFAFQNENRNVEQTTQHSVEQAIEHSIGLAENKAAIDYGFHLVISKVDQQVLIDIKNAIKNLGVSSFKMFMAYPAIMVNDASIYQCLKVTGDNGGLICLHAENGPVIDQIVKETIAKGLTEPKHHGFSRPALMEAEATHRVIKLSELTNAPIYIVHVSCKESLLEVISARQKGLKVFAETCPHYLFFDDSVYKSNDFEVAKFVISPPLRKKEDQDYLWKALVANDLQVISTDHCPYCINEGHLGKIKQKPLGKNDFSKIPNGAPGIESRLPVIFEGGVNKGIISLNRFVELVSTAPAKIFGLFPQKGTIAVGSDADIILFDPKEKNILSASNHQSNVDYTLYEGMEINGKIKKVFLRGKLIVENDKWLGKYTYGKYLKRSETCQI